ncbi:MAG: hypothetical protein LBG43_06185 [Treponema sp.]|nr:hypothetical protein [Treponema sp.]
MQEHLKDVYAVDVPPEMTSRVTDEAKELAAGRRGRALEPFYPALFMGAPRANIRARNRRVWRRRYG